jgi:mRNA interferase RelE/StbE
LAWHIKLSDTALKALQKLDKPVAQRITRFLRERIASCENPRLIGAALRGSEFGNYWKYRVGDWRVICEIKDGELTVLVLSLGNRREIYQ